VIIHGPAEEVAAASTGTVYSSQMQTRLALAERQFKIFAVLWAIAALFHMAHSSVFDEQLNFALLTLCAFFVILRPSLGSFVALIFLQLFDAIFRMPFTTNHWIFTAFVNITFLQVFMFYMIRHRTFQVKGGDLFKTFARLVRIEVIILYFFAVFHKLNTGFFSLETSCATDLLKAQHLEMIIGNNQFLYSANAYFTIIVELSIPVMLCFRKTRTLGVLVGLFFHSVLSYSTYNAFYDFSAMMFAAYFLFLGPGFTSSLYEIPKSFIPLKRSFLKNFSTARLWLAASAILILLVAMYLLNKRLNTFHSVHLYFFATAYSLVYTICLIRYMYVAKPYQTLLRSNSTWTHWSFFIVPVIIFLNGTSPYLGLKTENSFAMFSNLRTEGGKTNHYLVPANVQLFDYQHEVVEIISSSDPGLQALATSNKAMVLFEFRNYVHGRKPEAIQYTLNGERHNFSSTEKSSWEALGKNPYILTKLMKFRPFSPEGPQPCAH
jgi:hypothetical protein